MVSAGFIGAGFITERHLPNLKKLGRVNIVALTDIDKAKEKTAIKYGANFYSDYREMLDRENLDVVFICVPPFVHGELEIDCIERGIHLFIEKPIALSMDTAKKIEEKIKEKNLHCQVGHHWRYFDTAILLKDILTRKARKMGIFEGKYWGGLPSVPWWWRKDKCGGQVIEQTCHIFDFIRFLFGEFKNVYANFATRLYQEIKDFDIEDVSVVSLRLENVLIGVITSTTEVNFPGAHEIHLKFLAKNLEAVWGAILVKLLCSLKIKKSIFIPR